MYKKIRINKGKTKDEHRLKVEERIGRTLSFNEVVHHRDENKTNNQDNNLTLMSRSKHTSMHMLGRKLSDATKEKLRLIGMQKRTKAKLTIEQVTEIKKLLKQNTKVSELCKKFNVCRSNIYQIKRGDIYDWVKAE